MQFRMGKALAYAVLIWIIGFVWGSIVFMTPALKSLSPIPFVSNNPAISFPLLVILPVVTYLLAKSYLKTADDKAEAGLTLGIVFSLVSILLDLVVLVFLLKAGFRFFGSLTVWVAYLMLFTIPRIVGRSLPRKSPQNVEAATNEKQPPVVERIGLS
ncbi:MAG TPA: hypothetical protein VJU86_21965 [Pyrinomonadaceae bacterium]|nr:hypothetical protein [Pyrinomonadaceae bacterium]